ncbi:MAG: hypothetical protein ACO395_09250 [Pontimonas sp.]
MAFLNNEVLDDPILADGQVSFNGGMASNTKAALLAQDQAQELRNVALDRRGRGNSRAGFHYLHYTAGSLDGGAYFDTPSVEQMVVAANGALLHLVPSGDQDTAAYTETAISGYTYTEGNPVSMAQLVDKLYLADGSQRLYEWDGTTLKQVVTGSGTNSTNPLVAGAKYLVSHTWRLFASGVSTAPDTVYVSDFLAGAEWAAASFRVGGGEGQAITAIHPWHDYFLAVFKEASVYVVNCTPLTTAGAPTDPDGTLETAMFPIQLVNGTTGCVSHRTVAQVGFDLFFLARDGVRSLQRSASELQFGVSEPISAPIQDYIDRINWNAIGQASATFYKGRYVISLPLDSDTTPQYTFSYNLLTQSWEGYWDLNGPKLWVQTRFSSLDRLNAFADAGYITRWREHVPESSRTAADYMDEDVYEGGGDYSARGLGSRVLTRAYNFNEVLNAKTGFICEIEFEDQGFATTLVVEYALDASTPLTLATESISSGVILPVTLPITFPSPRFRKLCLNLQQLGSFRELALRVSTTEGPLLLRSVSVTAFPDTMNTRYGFS